MQRLLVLGLLAVPSAAAYACPPRAALDALAKEAWDGRSIQPTCTPVRASEPLTFVVDIAAFEGKRPPRGFDPASNGGSGYAALIDKGGTVRWQQTWGAGVPGDWYDWRVLDLDGDGRDELVAHHDHYGHVSSSESLAVYTVDHGEVTEAPSLPLADHVSANAAGMNSCTASYRFVRAGRRTLVETIGKHGSDPALNPVCETACASPGKHVYRWTDRAFVEAP